MPPNRSRSNSNAYQNAYRSNSPNVPRQPPRHPNQVSQSPAHAHLPRAHQGPSVPRKGPPHAPSELGMSPASRYNHNLKVLRRHDPSIASIFDQFSHVCLYHYTGTKWEKKGYEGSMFLFEREQEPKYGFFILNRMGMDDYIQCLGPTDLMDIADEYLMYSTSTPYLPSHRNSPDISRQPKDTAVKPEIIGFWMFATDAREPMNVVMMRLHDYVKKGLRYPDEYRYGPGRKPPPNPNAMGLRHPGQESGDEGEEYGERTMDGEAEGQWGTHKAPETITPATANIQLPGMSEVDMLFAKLAPPPPTAQAPALNDIRRIFNNANAAPLPPGAASESSNPDRGLALLDSIFASVTPVPPSPPHPTSIASRIQPTLANGTIPHIPNSTFPPPPSASHPMRHAEPHAHLRAAVAGALEIRSPKPSMGALPQILTTDVIDGLMGLPTSRSASTASSSQRGGSRERGYIADRGEDDGFSEAEPAHADTRAEHVERGVRTLALALGAPVGGAGSGGSLTGDSTPRARARRGLEPDRARELRAGPEYTSTPPPPALQRQGSGPRPASGAGSGGDAPAFRAGSELWPHQSALAQARALSAARAPLDDRSFDLSSGIGAGSGEEVVGDEDVVELDFSEISVLSDLQALEARGRPGGRGKGRGKDNGPLGIDVQTNGGGVEDEGKGEDPRKKQRRGRKDRGQGVEADKHSVEVKVDVTTAPAGSSNGEPSVSVMARTMVNGHDKGTNDKRNGKVGEQVEAATTSTTTTTSGTAQAMQSEWTKDAILKEVARAGIDSKPKMDRNGFVREVLTLIHTDKAFVDRLYQGYLDMA